MEDGSANEYGYKLSPMRGISNDDVLQMLEFGLAIEDLQASGILPPDPPVPSLPQDLEQDSKPSAEEEEPEEVEVDEDSKPSAEEEEPEEVEVDEDLIAIEDMLAMVQEEEEEKKRREEAKMDKIRRELAEVRKNKKQLIREALERERATRPTTRPRRPSPPRPPPIRTDRFGNYYFNPLGSYSDRGTSLTLFNPEGEVYTGFDEGVDEAERLATYSIRNRRNSFDEDIINSRKLFDN